MMQIRWALSELLYWIGHGFYKLDCAMMFLHPKGLDWEAYVIWENSPRGRLVAFCTDWIGWCYQRFMVWSIDVKGFGPGPWTKERKDKHGAFFD